MTFIAYNNFLCSDTLVKQIQVFTQAIQPFSLNPVSGCSPLAVSFPTVNGVTGYTWQAGDGSASFTGQAQHTYTNQGPGTKVFTVILNAQTSDGCYGTGTSTISVFNKPVADFSPDVLQGCSPLNVEFTNTSTGNHAHSQWDFGAGKQSGYNHGVFTFTAAAGSPAQSFPVKLSIVTNHGCRDSVTKQISLFARPLATFHSDSSTCVSHTFQFNNLSQGGSSYTWDLENGTSTAFSVSAGYVNTTRFVKTFNIRLRAVNNQGCSDSTNRRITLYPQPEFFIGTSKDSGCSPLNVRFYEIAGVKNYQWRINNQLITSSGSFNHNFSHHGLGSRSFTVQLLANDQFGCSDTSQTTIKVYPQPDVKFSTKTSTVFLNTEPVIFLNQSSAAVVSFFWTFGDDHTSFEKDPEHMYRLPGKYLPALIGISRFGCRDTFLLTGPVVIEEESYIKVPNAFSPSTEGPKGKKYDPADLSNDIFYPLMSGAKTIHFTIFSRWGELLFETQAVDEGWDGYYKGKLCPQDAYIWKINATFADGKLYNKTGDVLLIR